LHFKIAVLILSMLALGSFAVGCGGDSGSGDDEGSLDKATFAKRADTICEEISGRMFAELRALAKGKPVGSEGETALAILKQIAVPGYEDELEQIRELGVPSDAKPEVETFLEKMQQMIATAHAKPQDFATGAAPPPYEAVELLGRRLGITACPAAPVGAS
jgi:hypothetical protein